jgi:[CysO sulfur-carrier protein]-S-L-cysteine hydrolase
MLAQAVAALPNECCGLLAGRDGRVTHSYPLRNALASPVRYESDPRELFAAHKDMKREGTEHLAIYHSHPTSDPVPSRTDLERNFHGPDVVQIIISLKHGEPRVQAWRLGETSYDEVGWACIDAV